MVTTMQWSDAERIIKSVHAGASAKANRYGPEVVNAGQISAGTPWAMLTLAVEDVPTDLPEPEFLLYFPTAPSRVLARKHGGSVRVDPKLVARVLRYWPGPVNMVYTDAETVRLEGNDGSSAVIAGLTGGQNENAE